MEEELGKRPSLCRGDILTLYLSVDCNAVLMRLSPRCIKDLVHRGVCARCVLRYNGVHESSSHYTNQQEINSFLLAHELDVSCFSKSCSTCLGILHHNDKIITIASSIVEIIKNKGYDSHDFNLAIALPNSVLLRNFSLWTHLVNYHNIPELWKNDVVDLKAAIRSIVNPELEKLLKTTSKGVEGRGSIGGDGSLSINIRFDHPESDNDYLFIPAPKHKHDIGKKRNRQGQSVEHNSVPHITNSIKDITTGKSTLPDSLPVPPPSLSSIATLDVSVERSPVYITGRYCKYERGLSQTPWEVEGVKLAEYSVQDLVSLPLQGPAFFDCEKTVFHSAGREDVDVRMLGNGRPFVLEFVNAKRAVFTNDEYKKMEEAVNASTTGISIHNIRYCDKNVFTLMKDGAESKRKTYCCVVVTNKDVTENDLKKLEVLKELILDQITPIRVLHRRTLMNRKKIIHSLRCEYTNPRSFLLYIETSAGTYVKEFVHGDLGRTQPNVGSILGCGADILQLDVMNLTDDLSKPNENDLE